MAYNYLFKNLIHCYCKANYRGQLQRKVPVYICSNYSNYGECTRRAVKEELLLYYVNKYCKKKNIEFEINHYFLADIIENIVVDEEGKTTITYKSGEVQEIQ
ncbi:recombinase zinc beta ribbon domain-containing protein [Clostridium felsineum]|uniref:recombinase zinc beta ribbon domain-containing protein n=1 Tax=Clostridium felsineum TaxID=36839 RepID=UPI00098CAFFB|nr:recombinase zinc beta ribbon domain-containing protein [Clostridium felsineum]URZ03025.1 hypothetical protein CLAUR_030710 [Clostridium felsineum]